MRKLILFLVLGLCLPSTLMASSLILCLQAQVGKTQVSLSLDGDDWLTGQSKYCKQNESMTLKQTSYKTLKNFKGRPSLFLIQWNESYKGKITGYYSVQLQGANFYKAYFVNAKTKKRTNFNVQVINEISECVCQ